MKKSPCYCAITGKQLHAEDLVRIEVKNRRPLYAKSKHFRPLYGEKTATGHFSPTIPGLRVLTVHEKPRVVAVFDVDHFNTQAEVDPSAYIELERHLGTIHNDFLREVLLPKTEAVVVKRK